MVGQAPPAGCALSLGRPPSVGRGASFRHVSLTPPSFRGASFFPKMPPPLCDWRSNLCLHTVSVLGNRRWQTAADGIRIGLETGMLRHNGHGARALSGCVSPSFSENPSGDRAALRPYLLFASSRLLGLRHSASRCAVRSATRNAPVCKSLHRRQSQMDVRFHARSPNLLETARQCRAAE
jgi:hypothetical protein